jgi:hypothetical protein
VESQEQNSSLRWRIAIVSLVVVFVHVVLCLCVIFIPATNLPKNKVITLYRQLFVLGPFFADSRIKSSHHLSVRYKSKDGWSAPREFANENFLAFSKLPLRFDRLPFNDYEKRLSYSVGELAQHKSFEAVKKSAAFRELNEFILQEYIGVPVDSINMIYGWQQYDPRSEKFQLDTVFNYTYNTSTIDKARK